MQFIGHLGFGVFIYIFLYIIHIIPKNKNCDYIKPRAQPVIGGMQYKLSRTEMMVGEMYFRQGMKPRDIADKLGISVNTVYKAISKYKAVYGDKWVEEQEEPASPASSTVNEQISESKPPLTITFTVTTQYSPSPQVIQEKCDDQLQVELLLKMAASINELFLKINELSRKIEQIMQQPIKKEQEPISSTVSGDAPEFIRDNVWIDVIRSKHSH
mgnify:CR=1 FL=1